MRVVLLGLGAVWLGVFVAGMLLGQPNQDHSKRLACWAKLVMIAVTLVIGALWWFGYAVGTAAARFALLIFLGLIACAVGDVLLAGLFPFRRAEVLSLAGFGIGHLFFIAGVLQMRNLMGVSGAMPVLVATGAGVVVTAGAWFFLIRNPEGSRTLNIASLIYGMLLGASVAVAFGLTIETGALAVMSLGLILFMISDFLVAQHLIRKRNLFPYMRDAMWLVYSAAQVLIAFAIGTGALLGAS
jgi:hypothetical protein